MQLHITKEELYPMEGNVGLQKRNCVLGSKSKMNLGVTDKKQFKVLVPMLTLIHILM